MTEENQSTGGFSKEEEEWIKAQRAREAERQKRKSRSAQGDDTGAVNINSLMDVMVIMLVFLLKSYGEEPIRAMDEDLKVPRSNSLVTPEDMMTVSVTRTEILVNDRWVVDVRDGEIDPSHISGDGDLRIEPLLDSLSTAVERSREESEILGEDWEPRITVIADQITRHRLLLQVLFTATEAELSDFRFAIIQTTSESLGGFGGE
jgi:biopolymer transport protein ExbD